MLASIYDLCPRLTYLGAQRLGGLRRLPVRRLGRAERDLEGAQRRGGAALRGGHGEAAAERRAERGAAGGAGLGAADHERHGVCGPHTAPNYSHAK